jgi:hypothetical protein
MAAFTRLSAGDPPAAAVTCKSAPPRAHPQESLDSVRADRRRYLQQLHWQTPAAISWR